MTLKPEAILIVVLGVVVIIVMVLNDLWKRYLVERAEARGKPVREDLRHHKISWGTILVVFFTFVLFAVFYSNPDLVDRDWGPLNPFMRWMFKKPF